MNRHIRRSNAEDVLASGCRAIGGRKPDKRCTAKPESVIKVERLEPTHPFAKMRLLAVLAVWADFWALLLPTSARIVIAAGPVGAVVGGAVGAATGTVGGILGVPPGPPPNASTSTDPGRAPTRPATPTEKEVRATGHGAEVWGKLGAPTWPPGDTGVRYGTLSRCFEAARVSSL
jgi:hypothetical protein